VTAEPVPSLASGSCPLCGTATLASDDRCAACGFTLAGVDGRPEAFSWRTLWWSVAVLGVVYLVTIAIVAMTR
jgi:hypothetical protein